MATTKIIETNKIEQTQKRSNKYVGKVRVQYMVLHSSFREKNFQNVISLKALQNLEFHKALF